MQEFLGKKCDIGLHPLSFENEQRHKKLFQCHILTDIFLGCSRYILKVNASSEGSNETVFAKPRHSICCSQISVDSLVKIFKSETFRKIYYFQFSTSLFYS